MSEVAPPLVTIVVAAYNVERYLAESLTSILGQTYRNTEVILVDDGSADGTFAVAQTFRDDRLRCVRLEQNGGALRAWDFGIREARGEFVAIYHSDDVYEPTIVEKEVGWLRAHPRAGGAFTMFQMMTENGKVFGGADVMPALAVLDEITYDDVFPICVRLGDVMFATPIFMGRREALVEAGPFDAKWDIVADFEMWLRLARRRPVGIINERLFRYRHSAAQWTHRWRRLRTHPDRALDLVAQLIERDGWRERLTRRDFAEFAYRQRDDATTRAANAVIRGDATLARTLLHGRFPVGTCSTTSGAASSASC